MTPKEKELDMNWKNGFKAVGGMALLCLVLVGAIVLAPTIGVLFNHLWGWDAEVVSNITLFIEFVVAVFLFGAMD